MMPEPRPLFIDKHIPAALMFTIILQVGGVVWWASMTDAQNRFRDTRLQELETRRMNDVDRQQHILERLTRLETRSEAQLDILQRLDAQLAHKR
ncbi:MAG: hypothetical protein EB059_06985 [Alphaproteobacteria bacterium]|nr:hypothetical protein [Alphaproteobacteria bacterium]